ncbi:MAG TPA: triose-phosphate isomerase [Candidatus Ozemobacteraceae bacterium]|nr:triose-phosphate isomerase [Candidatus Ozemobacteraceae bacterium]
MGTRPVLIVSDSLVRAALFEPPFSLSPEGVVLTGFASLRFLALERYPAVVLHEPPADLLRKLALGIHDQPDGDGLWQALNQVPRVRLYQLVVTPTRPGKDAVALDIENIVPADLGRLVGEAQRHPQAGVGTPTPGTDRPAQALTADDIRERFQRGERSLSAATPMTDWARETAAALGMRLDETPAGYRLLRVKAFSRRDLEATKDLLFQVSTRYVDALFIVDLPYLPIVRDLVPSLRGRLVAPRVHWADYGAYTGEVSVEMLTDMDCRGALVPDTPPWTKPEHLQKLVQSAMKRRLLLFLPETLARAAGCDIMTPLPDGTSAVTTCFKLVDGRENPPPEPPPGTAVLMTSDQLSS